MNILTALLLSVTTLGAVVASAPSNSPKVTNAPSEIWSINHNTCVVSQKLKFGDGMTGVAQYTYDKKYLAMSVAIIAWQFDEDSFGNTNPVMVIFDDSTVIKGTMMVVDQKTILVGMSPTTSDLFVSSTTVELKFSASNSIVTISLLGSENFLPEIETCVEELEKKSHA